jgi:hypothetical protein
VKADPQAQQQLLALQAVDTALAQLAHRRDHLPELAELAEADERLATLRDDVVRAETEVSDLDREQKRVDRDVEQVRARADKDRARLESGAASAKELEGLQHEVESLARRQTTLEDQELEVMERREEAESALAKARAELDNRDSVRSEIEARRDKAFEEIDAARQAREAEHKGIVGDVPADLLALYDKVRAQQGGVGAAALRQRRCEGCRIELAGNELTDARHAPSDEVLRCENCRRILIRTPESGL